MLTSSKSLWEKILGVKLFLVLFFVLFLAIFHLAGSVLGAAGDMTLTASAFSDTDAEDAFTASQWVVRDSGGDVYDQVLGAVTSITVPAATFTDGATYWWKVRYQDQHLVWSDYSAESSFVYGSGAGTPTPASTSTSTSVATATSTSITSTATTTSTASSVACSVSGSEVDYNGDGITDGCGGVVNADAYIENISDFCAGSTVQITYYYFTSNLSSTSNLDGIDDVHDIYISTDGGVVYNRIASNINYSQNATIVNNLPSNMPSDKIRNNPASKYVKTTYSLTVPSQYVSDQAKILVHVKPSQYQTDSVIWWPEQFDLGNQFIAPVGYLGHNYRPGASAFDASDFTNTVRTQNCPHQGIRVVANPDGLILKPGALQQYSAKVYDPSGQNITANCPVTWSMQASSAGSINSSGLLTATSALGVWNDAVKAEVNCFGLSDFALMSFVTTNEERRLDRVFFIPRSGVTKEPITRLPFKLYAYDQFNFFIGSGVNYSYSLLDSRIGTFDQDGQQITVNSSKNYGCYPNKIKGTASYNGVSMSAFGTISILPPDYVLSYGNRGVDLGSKVLASLTGAGRSFAAQEQTLTLVSYNYVKYIKPGQAFHFIGYGLDQLGNTLMSGVNVKYILRDPAAGQLSSSGKFIATINIGSYPAAIEIVASQGSKVISRTFDINVTKEGRQATRIYAAAMPSPKYFALKTLKMWKGSGYSIYSLLYDQFGDAISSLNGARIEDVSGKNLITVSGRSNIVANETEGTFKKAIKITYDIDRINQSIVSDNDKIAGQTPELYLDLDIHSSNDNPSACFVESGTTNTPKRFLSYFTSLKSLMNLLNRFLSYFTSLKSLMNLLNYLLLLAALLASLLSNLLTLFSSLPFLQRLINGLFSLFAPAAWPGRKPSWGIVYDAVSKKPIKNVILRIFAEPSGRLKSAIRSNQDGAFGFILPPGKYSVIASMLGFEFPSKLITGSTDGRYQRIYRGGVFDVAGNGQQKAQVNINIPLDRANTSTFDVFQIRTLAAVTKFFQSIRLPIMILGTLSAAYMLFSQYRMVDYAIGLVYIGLWAIEVRNMIKKRAYGMVRDNDGKPLSLALIRVTDIRGKLKSTVVTGDDGKFQLNLDSGQYRLDISRGGYKNIRTQMFRIDKIQDIGRLDLKLDKLTGQ